MSPVVFVADEQDEHPVEAGRWLRLASDVLSAEKVNDDDTEVSVLFVNEQTIAELNEKFMGKAGITDVLSFPIDEVPVESGRTPDSGGTGPGGNSDESDDATTLLGDVVICPSVARRNAPDHAGKYEDELALLLVHGLLHLLGMDHDEEQAARTMEQREKALLDQFYGTLADSAWSTMQDTDEEEE